MIVTISCPLCAVNSQMSLKDGSFDGGFLCWKCKAKLHLQISDGEVQDCQAIDDEKFNELLELDKLKKKFQKSEDD